MAKKRMPKWLKTVVAVLLLLALLYAVDISELKAAFSELTLEAVVYLALVGVALIYVSAFKWQLFLTAFGNKVSIRHLFGLYLVGYFVNLILPSYLGGDAVRSWYVGKRVGQHQALTATILERYTGFVAMISLALVFMWFVDTVTFELRCVVFLVALGLAAVTWFALSPHLMALFEKIEPLAGVVVHLHKIQTGLRFAGENRSLLLKTLALSFLFHCLTVVNTLAAGFAVGWVNVPVWDLFVVLPLILLIGAIPIAPAGLGIQEGAFYFFLSAVGATPAQALAVALVLRAKLYVLASIGGVIWWRMRSGNGSSSSTQSLVDETPPMISE